MHNEQIENMVDRGISRKFSVSKLLTYDGPVFYLFHHEVFKPESITTQCRIVFNSPTNFKGNAVNNYWEKGPDLLNIISGILISFREN